MQSATSNQTKAWLSKLVLKGRTKQELSIPAPEILQQPCTFFLTCAFPVFRKGPNFKIRN